MRRLDQLPFGRTMSLARIASIQTGERRQRRSENPYQAADLYLDRLKGRKTLHAAAVADRTGLPLAGTGSPSELELLALWGALSETERERYQASLDDICRRAAGVSWNCALGGDQLSASGVAESQQCASRIERDLKRIFAPLCACGSR
jgi:hypothetical protein